MRKKSFGIILVALAVASCAGAYRPLQFIGGADLSYPPNAKAAGIEGRVVVSYDVTAEGRVANAEIAEAQPPGVFEEAALAAVRSWRFRPVLQRGQAVAAPARVSEVIFKLGEGGDPALYERLPAPESAGGRAANGNEIEAQDPPELQ